MCLLSIWLLKQWIKISENFLLMRKSQECFQHLFFNTFQLFPQSKVIVIIASVMIFINQSLDHRLFSVLLKILYECKLILIVLGWLIIIAIVCIISFKVKHGIFLWCMQFLLNKWIIIILLLIITITILPHFLISLPFRIIKLIAISIINLIHKVLVLIIIIVLLLLFLIFFLLFFVLYMIHT